MRTLTYAEKFGEKTSLPTAFADLEKIMEELEREAEWMYDNYQGCDWCCGGGDERMERLQKKREKVLEKLQLSLEEYRAYARDKAQKAEQLKQAEAYKLKTHTHFENMEIKGQWSMADLATASAIR